MPCRKTRMISLATALALVALAAALVALAPAAIAGPADQKVTAAQVLDLQHKLETAQIAGDTKTIASLMADNATVIHGSGRLQNKTEFVAGSAAHPPSSIEGPDRKVILFDGGALTTGPVTASFNVPGANGAPPTPRTLHFYISTLWVPTDAGWQVLLSQTTEAAPAPPAGR